MTNINPNDDVGRISHNIKKENKVKKNEKTVAETKSVEASSLDALNSYGKVNVAFKGIFNKKPKAEEVTPNLLWNKLSKTNLSEEEKSSLLNSICNSIYTEEQLDIANKFVSEPVFYENKTFQNVIRSILLDSDNAQNAELKLKLIDKFLMSKELRQNSNAQDSIGLILLSCPSKIDEEFAFKFLSDSSLYDNEGLKDVLVSISFGCYSKEKKEIVDKYLSDSELYTNKIISKQIATILNKNSYIQGEGIVDTFLSDFNLYKNKWVMENLSSLVDFADIEIRGNLVKKFLSDSKLYENKGLQENILDIFESIASQTSKGVLSSNIEEKVKLIDDFLSKPEMYENELLQKNIKYVLDKVYSDADLKTMDKFLVGFENLLNDGIEAETAVNYLKGFANDEFLLYELDRIDKDPTYKPIEGGCLDSIGKRSFDVRPVSIALFKNIDELFERINLFKFGPRLDKSLENWVVNVGDKNVRIKTDNNIVLSENLPKDVDLENVIVYTQEQYEAINDAVKSMQERGLILPDEIYLTSFLEFGDSGCFIKQYPDKIFISSPGIGTKPESIKKLIYHETAHLTDCRLSDGPRTFLSDTKDCEYDEKLKFVGTEKNKVLTDDIKKYISSYALVNVHEFVAEVSKLIAANIIGLDFDGKFVMKDKDDSLPDEIIDTTVLNNIMNLYMELTEGKIVKPEVIVK